MMVCFVDAQREQYGVEPICQVLPIAPSTYYEHKARQADPSRVPDRVRRDAVLCDDIERVWDDNYQVYVARKVWKEVARCTVERLMWKLDLRGTTRGKQPPRTTRPEESASRPSDLVDRTSQ